MANSWLPVPTVPFTNGRSAAPLSLALVLINGIIVSWVYDFAKVALQHSFTFAMWKPSSVACKS